MRRRVAYLKALVAVKMYRLMLLVIPFEKKIELIKMADHRIVRPFIGSKDKYQMDIVARTMEINANEISKYARKIIR